MSDTDDRTILDFGAHLLPLARHEDPMYWDFDVAAERFTAGGLDGAVLSYSRHIGNDDPEATRDANDQLFEIIQGRENYFGLAALPNGAGGAAAAEELERCLEMGWNGGAIQTEANGVTATDEEMEAVYEVADRAGAPVLIHPKINESLGAGVLDDRYLLNKVFGREVALCETICRMIHDGILDRHPDFTPVIHHTAGNIAAMNGRIKGSMNDRQPDHLKSYGEFSQQLSDRVYLDTSGYFGDPTAFDTALGVFSASNMMLGTDYPYETETGEDFQAVIAGIDAVASPNEAKQILGENALKVLVNID